VRAPIRKSAAGKVAPKVVPKRVVAKNAHKNSAKKAGGKVAFRSDARQTATLVRVGRNGAANAIRASKALGLPIIYMEKGVIVSELPDGVKETVKLKKPVVKKSAVSVKKGMILHAKR
jgi:hypothetical protein